VSDVLSALRSHPKVVLAAAPSAGKTRMAIRIADQYRARHKRARILILTHGQLILRDQWESVLGRVDHGLSTRVIRKGSDAESVDEGSLIVSLPHTLQAKLDQEIDLLIVDEAHHYYFGTMVQRLIDRVNPKHQLLLTGTPSVYLSDSSFKVIGITVQELMAHGVVSDPLIELVEAKYALTLRNYLATGELKKDADLARSGTEQTLDMVLNALLSRLASSRRLKPGEFRRATGWREILTTLEKTMVVCHSQRQAQDVADFFASKGVSVALSISDLSEGGEELEKFKSDPKCNLFIVVNRGILGFDFDALSNMIDLSGTLNVNKLFQMLCRVVRRDPSRPSHKKIFIKVAAPEIAHISYFVMSFVVALSDPEYYFSYRSDLRTDLKIPVAPSFLEGIGAWRDSAAMGERKYPTLPELHTFETLSRKNGEALKTYAFTDLKTVRARLTKQKSVFSVEDCRAKLALCKTLTEFRKTYRGDYNWLAMTGRLDVAYEFFPKRGEYDLDECLKTAQKFAVKSDFREAHHGMFKFLKRTNQLHLLSFDRGRKTWTIKEAEAEARKYLSKYKFRRGSPGAFEFLERVAGMAAIEAILGDRSQVAWTLEAALRAASKCRNRREFRVKHCQAWRLIVRMDAMDELDKILPPQKPGPQAAKRGGL
jgi:superfamily II DNA or RNA helicase